MIQQRRYAFPQHVLDRAEAAAEAAWEERDEAAAEAAYDAVLDQWALEYPKQYKRVAP